MKPTSAEEAELTDNIGFKKSAKRSQSSCPTVFCADLLALDKLQECCQTAKG